VLLSLLIILKSHLHQKISLKQLPQLIGEIMMLFIQLRIRVVVVHVGHSHQLQPLNQLMLSMPKPRNQMMVLSDYQNSNWLIVLIMIEETIRHGDAVVDG